MNQLEKYIAANKLNESQVVSILQEDGIVSDNCVRAGDVADTDCPNAIRWLKNNPDKK